MQEIVSALLDMMPDTITVQRVTTDEFGAETLSTLGTFRAYISGPVSESRSRGRMQKSSVTAIVAGTGFRVTDVFTLPARFSPNQPKATSIDRATDENGAHHETIYF